MKYFHYTEKYLISPTHPVTINLIGCGGTGSQVLNNLARIHTALRALGHPGFHVTAWDEDKITDANLGRQLFAPGDIGLHKSMVLIGRINRFYNCAWQAKPKNFKSSPEPQDHRNITISCVDNVKTRRDIGASFKARRNHESPYIPYYWMDIGNNQAKGQVIMGTVLQITQPKQTPGSIKNLRNVFDFFPKMEKSEGPDSGPSCSLAEALEKQDLFINSMMAQYAGDIIWKMFRHLRIEYHGVFVNMETLITNPIRITK
jgi:PRTRC genetic system ThiF family protein